jgi:exopolyphosphatase/guanosine-5'-triphosphate,3'-diphosphate pyrophosphatase
MSRKSNHPAVLDSGQSGRRNRREADSVIRPAVVDIGSNSVRLVIYDALRRNAAVILNEKVECGLGSRLGETGRLPGEGIQMALRSLTRFNIMAEAMGVTHMDLIATAAVRDAANGPEFAEEAERLCGRRITVLNGEEEARLSALGVLSGIPDAEGIAADLGGGSLEISLVGNGEADPRVTLPLGPLRLIEFGPADSAVVRKTVDAALAECAFPQSCEGQSLYLVGGAWRAFAKTQMERSRYPLPVIHRYSLDPKEAAKSAREIMSMDRKQLARIPALVSKRREPLPYAVLVMERLIKASGPARVVFSAHGLREGWLQHLLPGEEMKHDPLLAATADREAREARQTGIGDALYRWTTPLFQDESEARMRLRRAACRLSDIGWHDHPDLRGVESMNRILRMGLPGTDHPGLAFMAYAVFNRYGETMPKGAMRVVQRLLSDGQIRRAILLGRALRLGYVVSGGVPEILGATTLLLDGGKPDLVLPNDGSAPADDQWCRHLTALRKAVKPK